MAKKDPHILFAILLGILIAAIVILQIVTCNTSTTKLETTLFSILQFLFSLAFTWILSSMILKGEFMTSQKKFAIAAYRRIKEVDKGVERLIERLRYKKETLPNDTTHELDVALEMATGIRETIKSSTADWADIIGEEVSVFEKIENIRDKQSLLRQEAREKELKDLISSLPYELQILTKEEPISHERVALGVNRLEKEKKERGYVDLYCFWNPKFERKISDFSIGDRLNVSTIDAKEGYGSGVILVKDESNKDVGVVTNRVTSELHYDEFRQALIQFVDKNKFKVEITHIESTVSVGDRIYFHIKTMD